MTLLISLSPNDQLINVVNVPKAIAVAMELLLKYKSCKVSKSNDLNKRMLVLLLADFFPLNEDI